MIADDNVKKYWRNLQEYFNPTLEYVSTVRSLNYFFFAYSAVVLRVQTFSHARYKSSQCVSKSSLGSPDYKAVSASMLLADTGYILIVRT